MKYMLIIAGHEGGWEDRSPEEAKAEMGRWFAYTEELQDAGALVAGEGLQESATATTVRIRDDGERVVTDGPFAETKEQVGGFYVIDVANLDEAIEWAKRIPARAGNIEVRPVMDYSDPTEGEAVAAEASS